MISRVLTIAGLLMSFCAHAQTSISIQTAREQYLAGEEIFVRVRIENVSGQTMNLGGSDDWLAFYVESREGHPVEKLGEVPVRGDFSINTSEAATRELNIGPYFSFSELSRFQISAILKVDQWGGRTWISQPVSVSIEKGSAISSTDFGVPQSGGLPQMMTYSLLKVHRGKHLHLYFRLTDRASGGIVKTSAIGPMASFATISSRLDRNNWFHLLYQNGAQSVAHCIFDTSGNWLYRQSHDMLATSRPTLSVMPDGEVLVRGGLKRETENDFSRLTVRSPVTVPQATQATPPTAPTP